MPENHRYFLAPRPVQVHGFIALIVQCQPAVSGSIKPRHQTEQRALSAAGRPYDGIDLPALEGTAYTVQNVPICILIAVTNIL